MTDNSKENVVTRFAVSPTGFMHIGGVRTALFSYLYAKKHGGTFILRIEDTDKKREEVGATQHIIDTLRWLGIEWDYGPDKPHPEWGSAIQSERLEIYKTYALQLIEKGLAYPDPYTPDEVQAFRDQAEAEKRPFLFRDHRPESFEKWDGSKPLRLKIPEIKRYQWNDAVRGDLSGGEEMLDDIVIIKGDGYPTYNFCHIVDDHIMGVTHVMRSDEFIASMPRFLSIHDALEIDYPTFVSLPPIMGPSGKKKLSKRDGAKDVLEYGKDGYLPQTLINFLALIGWNPGGDQEIMSVAELCDAFSIAGIQKSGGAFNEEKLQWMNKQYLDTLSEEEFISYLGTDLPVDNERFLRLLPTIRERVHTRTEIVENLAAGEYTWALEESIDYETELLKWKQDDAAVDAMPRLEHALTLLETADFSSADKVKEALWAYAEEVGKGQLLWPLRVALTGQERSPDPFISAFVLDKDLSLKRVTDALSKLKEL